MTTIDIDGSRIADFTSFHKVFSDTLNFLDGYGNNMNAWIDCMRDIHEDTHMSKVLLPPNENLILKISSTEMIEKADPEILEALASCTAFVNIYLIENGWATIYLLFV